LLKIYSQLDVLWLQTRVVMIRTFFEIPVTHLL